MTILVAYAFLSGLITILSPCILPVLPLVLSGGVGGGRAKPYGTIVGFFLSFSFFTLALTALVQALGVPADAMRYVAVALILVFGLVMLVPALSRLFERGTARLSGVAVGTKAQPGEAGAKTLRSGGFWGGLAIGASLGLVWTPCVGPIMASVISLALTRRVDGGAVLITLAYTIGTSLPMMAVMLGGRALLARVPALSRNAAGIQRGFGAVMIALSLVIGFGWDRGFQAAVLTALPSYGTGLTALEQAPPVQKALGERGGAAKGGGVATGVFLGAPQGLPDDGKLGDYGRAPEFVAQGPWYQMGTAAGASSGGGAAQVLPLSGLSLADLRGKVVLVDFWTYSCVNCIRTLPFLRAWYEAYKDRGFVIVGVHSPEFEFEKVPSNVTKAMGDLRVTWPVVMDNDYAQWTAYANKYWPAHYFIDATGRVRYFHFGEGGYETAETVIRALLAEAGADLGTPVTASAPELSSLTPETYLGYERGRNLVSAVPPEADRSLDYRPAKVPGNGEWSLEGRWTVGAQYVVPSSSGILRLGFDAKDVYLVVEPEGRGRITVLVDGKPAAPTEDLRGGAIEPGESRLYHLVHLGTNGFHLLELKVQGNLRLFAFTFG